MHLHHYTQNIKIAIAEALSPAPLCWSAHVTDKRMVDYINNYKKKKKKKQRRSRAREDESEESNSDSQDMMERRQTPKPRSKKPNKNKDHRLNRRPG
jgi:hypothetical protein